MNNGYVAKANNPFWVSFKGRKIKLIDNPYKTVTTSGAHNGLNIWVIQHLLKIG
ncbi:hypothetical protein D3C85_1496290 [compost metagenome]